jgi:hypothetical protein
MRTSGRRRLDAVLLGVGALTGGVVTTLGGIAGDSERVTGMWVGAALSSDGGAAIGEVIDYDFGLAQEKHGIFRTIPGLSSDSPVSVRSDSAPDAIDAKLPDFSTGEEGLRLRIGDPNTTITGRHRYLIDYELRPGIVMRDDVISWDAVGTGWDVPVQQSEVHIVAPFELEQLRCDAGSVGDEGGCELTEVEPGHVVAEIGSLDANEGVTVTARRGSSIGSAPDLPAPPASAPPDPGAGLLLPAGVGSVVGAGAAAATSALVRRRGRERVGAGGAADAAWAGDMTSEVLLDEEELAHMATTEFAPPQGVTAAMGGVILRESVQPEHKVAWLIETAIEGAVDLEEQGSKSVRLHRTGAGREPATTEVLDTMFGARTTLDLGAYDSKFASGWRKVDVLLDDWQRRSGLWDPAGERRKAAYRGLGILAGIAGVVGLGIGGALAARWGEEWLALVAGAAVLAGAGFGAAVRAWELRVRTPQGSGLWLRVESFRRFLAGSEAYHAEEAAKRGVLREYTAWAVAVGEIDRWERAVAASTAIPAAAGLGYVYLAPMLMSSTSSAATAPSSSGGGGGGFGGGGVGGGGGGGGGGSW